jgi:PAS domain S-box-containing protein
MLAQILTGTNATYWYNTSNEFCSFFSSFTMTTDALVGLRDSDRATSTHVAQTDHAYFERFEVIFPVTYAAVAFLALPVVVFFVLWELRHLCRLLEAFPSEQKKAAVMPIRRGFADEPRKLQGDVQQPACDGPLIGVSFLTIVLYAGLTFITAEVFIVCLSAIEDFETANIWNYYIGIVQPRILEMTISTTQVLYLQYDGIVTNSTDQVHEIARVYQLADLADEATSALLQGTDKVPTILGVDSAIDELLLQPSCEAELNWQADFHSGYRCRTLNHHLVLFTSVVRNILDRREEFTGKIESEQILNMYHLMTKHIFPSLRIIDEYFTAFVDKISSRHFADSTILFAAAVVISIAAAVLVLIWKHAIDSTFDGAMMYLRRCSPAAIITNDHLLKYLLDETEEETVAMTPTQNIIHTAPDGIICLTINGIIESVSASVTTILGFIPEQLLGQHVAILFPGASGGKLQQRLEMMRKRECPRLFTDAADCQNENDALVACGMTLMGIENDDQLTAFVLILRDITELIQQQQAAETAKTASEKLLYEILPRDIVNRLNQEETDISFVVNSATLMFIDIQKFSAYALDLSPQEIMGNLSLIFAGFDNLLPKYPLLTKIKLIGDVYMCAAGLFAKVDEAEKHAEQMVRFALEALRSLDEANAKLQANLAVRIGVNTGGPIIAGVLGTDKPVFDIIGDPINIAARLQSTCIPGKVQISEDTFSLIKDHGFAIEPRGDVFLKGKGNRPAYLVSTSSPFPLGASTSFMFSGRLPSSLHLLPS